MVRTAGAAGREGLPLASRPLSCSCCSVVGFWGCVLQYGVDFAVRQFIVWMCIYFYGGSDGNSWGRCSYFTQGAGAVSKVVPRVVVS